MSPAPSEPRTEPPREVSMPVGVVVRQSPGVTRWAPHAWKAVAVLPGAGPGGWKELAREGDVVDYHAATADLVLHRTETEAYLVALNAAVPTLWAILRPASGAGGRPRLVKVTASAYEAQDHGDNGEDLVEPVPMPEGLAAWIAGFVRRHHREEAFVKRKRRPHVDEGAAEGVGDARVRQTADVYRAPRSLRERDP